MEDDEIAKLLAALENAASGDPQAMAMHTAQIVIGAVLKTPKATIVSHPNVIGPFHAMCRKNGIKPPPDVIISEDYYGMPAAFSPEKAAALGFTTGPIILMGPTFNFYYDEKDLGAATQAMLAHETAHFLAGDTESTPFTEYSADRLAAQMLGSTEPLRIFIEGLDAMPRLPHETAQREKLYGPQGQRLQNVMAADVNDRAELLSFIESYNERSRQAAGRSNV